MLGQPGRYWSNISRVRRLLNAASRGGRSGVAGPGNRIQVAAAPEEEHAVSRSYDNCRRRDRRPRHGIGSAKALRAQRQQAIINTVLAKERELMDAYELARLAELRAKEALQQSSHVDGDQDTNQKTPPRARPSVAQ